MSDPTPAQPIDLGHLARYTGGARELNCEIFRLFSQQCVQALVSLKADLKAGQSKGWRDTAHSLKGAASGIGAFGVAESAGMAESLNPQRDRAGAARVLTALGTRCEVVLAFIQAYLAAEHQR